MGKTIGQRELERLEQRLSLPDPAGDGVEIAGLLGRRYWGRVAGSILGGLAGLWWLIPRDGHEVTGAPVVFLALVGQLLGTAYGHLLQVGVRADGPRVASLQSRSPGDYLTPIEVALVRGTPALTLAAVVVAVVNLVVGSAGRGASGVVLGACGVALLLVVVLVRVARRALDHPATATTPAGLLWSEMLRAQMLRDLAEGTVAVSAVGGGGVLLWAVTTTEGVAGWFRMAGFVLGVLALLAMGLTVVTSVVDRRHRWARQHALAEVGA